MCGILCTWLRPNKGQRIENEGIVLDRLVLSGERVSLG